jgi:hypothetical protein
VRNTWSVVVFALLSASSCIGRSSAEERRPPTQEISKTTVAEEGVDRIAQHDRDEWFIKSLRYVRDPVTRICYAYLADGQFFAFSTVDCLRAKDMIESE